MKKLITLLITIALLSSCNKTGVEEPQQEETTLEKKVEAIILSPEMRSLLSPGTDFALRFFKQMSGEYADDNLFVSPYSLACALGMLYNGAEGKTKEEIAAVLGMKDYAPKQINEYYQTLTKGILAVDPLTDLGVANAVWSHYPFPAKKSFADLVKTYYDAEVSTMDFSLPSSLEAINDWCKEKTKGTIPHILDDLYPPMVLANAVYFKSPWTVKFDESKTEKKPFYNSNGTISMVQMMHQKELMLGYSHTSSYEFVRLPYANEAFAMNILLPKKGIALEKVIESMDAASWEAMARATYKANIHVTLSMPRFKLEGGYPLNDALQSMGMSRSFSADAEFFAMLDVPAFIGDVLQKSYVDVNEEGTEASAVTTIVFTGETGDPLPPPPHVTMVLDRPFIFAITEQSTGVLLFMGKVTNL